MNQTEDPLAHLIYISIPEHLASTGEGFSLDPSRLLPVETPDGVEGWNPNELSWEMIISAMLKVLAYDPEHEDSDYYRQFIKALRPNVVVDLTQAGIAKANASEFAIAEEIFRALVGLEPDSPRSVLNLALLLDQRAQNYQTLGAQDFTNDYEEAAAQWYQNALSLDEVLAETHLYAGHFYLRMMDISRALTEFRAFLTVTTDEELKTRVQAIVADLERRDLSDNQFKEAFDFIRMGQEETGLARIDDFLSGHPEVWNAHFLRGWALRRLKRYEDGVASFRKSIELGGGNADTLNELAICLMEQGQFLEARKALEQALNQEPENLKIISNLGILSLKQGRREEAAGFFQTVLELDPADSVAAEYLKLMTSQD